MALSEDRRRLVAALGRGLPLTRRPYRDLGRDIGIAEEAVIAALGEMLDDGLLKRLGIVVHHHQLGYRANAMVVWDIPDAAVAEVGRRFSAFDFVTLCYRRQRRPPEWPYNLFCMVHGRQRTRVLAQVEELAAACDLADAPRQVLFSSRRFKQRGAIYGDPG